MTKKTAYQGHLVFHMHNKVIFSRRSLQDRATVTISDSSFTFILIVDTVPTLQTKTAGKPQ